MHRVHFQPFIYKSKGFSNDNEYLQSQHITQLYTVSAQSRGRRPFHQEYPSMAALSNGETIWWFANESPDYWVQCWWSDHVQIDLCSRGSLTRVAVCLLQVSWAGGLRSPLRAYPLRNNHASEGGFVPAEALRPKTLSLGCTAVL